MKFYEHGGNQLNDNNTIDYSINLNPMGMPDLILHTIIKSAKNGDCYPDANCTLLRSAISKHEHLSIDEIVCGNGAADVIIRLCLFLKPKKALIIAPTFSEYEKAISIVGGEVEYFYLNNSFEITDSILPQINENTDILFICNPNNPTGKLIDFQLLSRISQRCIETNTFLVVDESFLSFTFEESAKSLFIDNKNIAIIKSFTKMYSMAGVRLGYLLSPNPKIIDGVEFCSQAWSVSSIAQEAGIVALKIPKYLEKTRELIKSEKQFLSEQLKILGIKVYTSDSNFLLCESNQPIADLLSEFGIFVRRCDNYVGLNSSYFRIAVRKHADNIKLINILKEVLNG